jgi:hypothetical protein
MDIDKIFTAGFWNEKKNSTKNYLKSQANVFIPHKDRWVGQLIDAHFESLNYTGEKDLDTKQRFDIRRDTFNKFGDWGTDYFLHDLQFQRLNNPVSFQGTIREAYSGKNTRPAIDTTGWEHQDPVIYGFEVIIDAASSPLLNGAVFDFIKQFESISEIASKKQVYEDFMLQFKKIFKLKGTPPTRTETPDRSDYLSWPGPKDNLSAFANSKQFQNRYSRGKNAYLGHYLQKISGLHKLIERNTSTENAYLNEYGKDIITLTFNEDVTGTMATLSHLYKMLYWSKPNGKSLIPENLLRFNCEIVVCEVRNFNRVRKSLKGDAIEILKDNVSRHIYSIRECQFYFDKPSHDDTIDLGNIKPFEGVDVTFDYKYSSTKFERWSYDPNMFGKYIGYNNGAMWKIGNNRVDNAQRDFTEDYDPEKNSGLQKQVPKFFTQKTNTLGQAGISRMELIRKYPITPADIEDEEDSGGGSSGTGDDAQMGAKPPGKFRSALSEFKKKSIVLLVRNAKRIYRPILGALTDQIKQRFDLFNSHFNKIKRMAGINGLDTEPNNVYLDGKQVTEFGIFFDVRNQFDEWLGDNLTTKLVSSGKDALMKEFGKDKFKDSGFITKIKEAFGFHKSEGTLLDIIDKYSQLPTVIANNSPSNGITYDPLQFPGFGQKPSGDSTDTNTKSQDPLTQIIKTASKLSDSLQKIAAKTTSQGSINDMLSKSPLQNTVTVGNSTIYYYKPFQFPGFAQKNKIETLQSDQTGNLLLKDILAVDSIITKQQNTNLKNKMPGNALQFPGWAQKPSLASDTTDVNNQTGNLLLKDILAFDSKLKDTLLKFRARDVSQGSIFDMLSKSLLKTITTITTPQGTKQTIYEYKPLQFPGFAQKPALAGDKTDVNTKDNRVLQKIIQDDSKISFSLQKIKARDVSQGTIDDMLSKSLLQTGTIITTPQGTKQTIYDYKPLQFPGFAQKPALAGDKTDENTKDNRVLQKIIQDDSKISFSLQKIKARDLSQGSIFDMLSKSLLKKITTIKNPQGGETKIIDYKPLQFPGFAQKPALAGDKTDVNTKDNRVLQKIIQDDSKISFSLQKIKARDLSQGSIFDMLKNSKISVSLQKIKARDTNQGLIPDMLKKSILPTTLQFPGFAQKPSFSNDTSDSNTIDARKLNEILTQESKFVPAAKELSKGNIDKILQTSILPPALQFPGFAQKPSLFNDRSDVVQRSNGTLNDILTQSTYKPAPRTASEGSLAEIVKKYSKVPSIFKPPGK